MRGKMSVSDYAPEALCFYFPPPEKPRRRPVARAIVGAVMSYPTLSDFANEHDITALNPCGFRRCARVRQPEDDGLGLDQAGREISQ